MNLALHHGKSEGMITALVMYLAMALLLGYVTHSLLFVRNILKAARFPEKKGGQNLPEINFYHDGHHCFLVCRQGVFPGL